MTLNKPLIPFDVYCAHCGRRLKGTTPPQVTLFVLGCLSCGHSQEVNEEYLNRHKITDTPTTQKT